MNILLINPHYAIERYMGRHLARVGWVLPPMGLLYVAAALEKAGHEVDVFDAQIDPRSLPEILNSFRPQVVGITSVTFLLASAHAAARIIRESLPGVKIVMGGVHASVRAEDVLKSPDVDAAVRGEGVWTIVELVEALGSGAPLAGIRGVSHRVDGKVVHEPDRPAVRDTDLLPFPARHLVDMTRYRMSPDFSVRYPFDIIFTAFGCPFRCIFCASQSVIGNVFRPRTIPSVMEELDQVMARYRLRSLMIADDNFGVKRERALEFCESFISRGYHRTTRWLVAARVDCVDREMLAMMKRAGCFMICYGIESGVPRLLEKLRKGITVEQSIEAVRLTREAGLRARGSFILGIPTETREESLATIRFSRSLLLHQVRFALATPFPGTELWDLARQEGQAQEEDWTSLSLMAGYRRGAPPYVPAGRDPDDLKRLQRSANLGFFFRPSTVVEFLGRVGSPRDIADSIQGAWQLARASLFQG